MSRGPVRFDVAAEEGVSPADAPPIGDDDAATPRGQAMRTAAAFAARPRSRLARFFWGSLGALVAFVLSVAAWEFTAGLLADNVVAGTAALVLVGLVLVAALLVAAKEIAAFARLRRIDALQRAAGRALADADLRAARRVAEDLSALYAGRDELAAARARFADRAGDSFDADAHLGLAEVELLGPLDAAAIREVEAAARQVAAVTAVVPLALADVATALTANLRMIRRIAEIYGGRAGTLGSWRVARAVFAHLIATGAVAVGDDMIGSVAGGSVLSRVSRRFGEGVVNGALTARVGVAALEVCRPLPFHSRSRPSVTQLVQRALTGLFGDARR